MESFLRIIGKKPLDKITVRDLVDDCGINRNTFYYYFQDIYAVLEEISRIVAASLPKGESLSVTMEAFFRGMGAFATVNPRAVRGLLMSLGQDGLERYFAKDMDAVILSCLSRKGELDRSKAYLERATALLRHAVFGSCVDLLHAQSNECFDTILADICRFLRNTEAALFEN